MKRQQDRTPVAPTQWLSGGGVMGELIANKDWAGSELGAIDKWPSSLRTALGICLSFPTPSCLVWGSQRVQLYNDAYAQVGVVGHSDALGQDFAHTWVQAWSSLRPCFERAWSGEPTRLEDQQVSFDREGATEVAGVTLSIVPVHDDAGGIGGLLVTLLEPSSTHLREELARAQADLEQHGHVISHDFRAPLRTLEQMSRIVLSDHAEQLPAGALGLLNHVASGAAKLALRADVLARVDVLTRHPLHRQDIDVAAMVQKVVAEVRSAAPERQVELAIGELPGVKADFELLRLVFSNVLSNAFKFTRNVEHARIEVSGRRQGHHVVYSVKDNGAGFDPQYARRLFGFFQRMHTEAEFEGLGMGLALAKRLIERHGGSIWAEAEKGRGAEFRFTLPA